MSGQDSSFYTPEARIRFADHLYCSGDFFRAGLEYQEAFKSSSDSLALLKWILSQWRSGNIDQITASVESLTTEELKSAGSAFLYGLYISRFDLKLPPPELASRIELLSTLNTHPASSIIKESNFFINSIKPELPSGLSEQAKQELTGLRERHENLSLKSPYLAGLLSMIVPGSGKIYTGETGDGVTAFILTSLFGYLAWTSFEHDHTTRGYILGAAGAGFYFGNIYGSFISAKLRNEKTLFDLKSETGDFIIRNNWFLGFSLELQCDP